MDEEDDEETMIVRNRKGFYLFWRFPLLSEQRDFSVVDLGESALTSCY